MEDLPVKDIAEVLKLSLPATKSRILRARLTLRERLTDAFKEKANERMQ
jgi:RNA polymerase sigma-70 factor (ECF subfamily)